MNNQEMLSTMLQVDIISPKNFGRIKDKLSRIGIASRKDNTLIQSCHILQSKGKYYICHFLELLALDGKQTEIQKRDELRRNTIANLLQSWGLLNIIDKDKFSETLPVSTLAIIPYKDKDNWNFKANYTLGKQKKRATKQN